MAQTRIIQQSFNGGEVTPEFFGRIEDPKRQNGLATMRNFVAMPHGPATKRQGTRFVHEVADSTKKTRLIPFVYSTTQAFAIEVGEGYFRFYAEGGILLYPAASAWSNATAYYEGDMVTRTGHTYQATATNTGSAPELLANWRILPDTGEYQVVNTYAEADLFNINYTQSNDVLTIVHPSYPPMELRRYGAYDWRFVAISFNSAMTTPGNPQHNAVTSVGTGTEIYKYKITAIGSNQSDESLASASSKTITYQISGITKANPGIVTLTTAHNLVVGQEVVIAGVLGMTQINGTAYINTIITMSIANDSFTLKDANGTPIDTTAYGTYTSGGTARGEGYGNDLLTTGNKNIITWSAISGATRYNVYKLSNGLYGYIGQTDLLTFTDDNIAADTSRTPPEQSTDLTGTGNYPAAVAYFEQRRIFAGTTNAPQTIWMTRTGTESNLNTSIPVRDDDAISFRAASRVNSTIRHIVPVADIVLLTNSGEWRVTSVNSDAITPTSISVRPQSYVGANNAQPILVNSTIVYAEGRGGHVREMAYNWQAGGYMTGDLSLRSPHLFDNKEITDMAFSRSPFPICWFVNDDGELLGLTYIPEQQVSAWHKHDTDGLFESVCSIPEGNEDAIYVIVKRTIDGAAVRYVERMASRYFAILEDAFFVDCGLTYDGASTTTITGLDHLEGCEVSILADGAVHPVQTVVAGSITLEIAASVVNVGLAITSDIETLPAAVAVEAYGQGRRKNINKVWPRLYRTSGVYVGPDADNLVELKQRTNEPAGTPPELVSEEVEVVIPAKWSQNGVIFFRHSDPLPMTLVSLSMEVCMGG